MSCYRTARLLAPDYRDLSALAAFNTDPAVMSDKRMLNRINRQMALAADKAAVQPSAKIIAPESDGQPTVDLYAFYPEQAAQPLALIYFMHSGGYLLGNARQQNAQLLALANRHRAAVVSVEYPLAYQQPFPADVNAAFSGLNYLRRQAAAFNLDSRKIVIMGESAGGGLAARLALKVRDQADFKPAGLVLAYPMLDYRTGADTSLYHSPNTGELMWTRELNQLAWKMLKGGQTIADDAMPYYSPATAEDLDGLPRTYLAVGDLDLFVNENLDFANRLIQAGVPVDLQLFSGVYHAFDMFNPQSPQTQAYLQSRTAAIERMLTEA